METPAMSGSRTIIAVEDRLANPHAGDVLREDFLVGGDIAVADVSKATGLSTHRLAALLTGTVAVDADADLRLTRYFGVTEGFFLRLQNAYDLEEAWCAHGEEFERIPRRAA